MPADNSAIAKNVLDHLNSWTDKPCVFSLEKLPKSGNALMLQPLPGSGVLKKYIDGSFIGLFSFAVYFRIEQADTNDKLSAYETLEDLAYWIEHESLPVLSDHRQAISIKQESTSFLSLSSDDTEDYQTVFNLTYKQSA